MRIELFPPESDTASRHWVRHDQAFAMMLRPGSIESGSKRSALEKFTYAAHCAIVMGESGSDS